jgi:hypothetical protein
MTAQTTIDPTVAVDELRTRLRGTVIAPGDAD